MCKSKTEIERDLLVFRDEILENRDSYMKIHDINCRLVSYYYMNHLTSEDMHIFEDPEIIRISNQATDQWFESMMNPAYKETMDSFQKEQGNN